jgi:hypothetical protein
MDLLGATSTALQLFSIGSTQLQGERSPSHSLICRGVFGTPTVFVNGVYTGAPPRTYQQWKQLIDSLLKGEDIYSLLK